MTLLANARVERPCSMKLFRHLVLIFLLISQARAGEQRSVNQPTEPGTFFREFVGLSDEQIRDVRSGKAIAIVLPSPVPDEVFVFGTVYINSTPEQYLKLASDLDALRKVPSFLALQKFSDPPRPADLDGFSFEDEDLKDTFSAASQATVKYNFRPRRWESFRGRWIGRLLIMPTKQTASHNEWSWTR